jgi:hypothetical protein
MSNVSYFSISKPRSVETTPVSFALSSQQWASDLYYIAAADFNGDGKIDLAGIDLTESTLSILLGNGDGTFQSPISYSVADYPAGIAVGDFNNDGKPDLALEGSSGGLHMLTIFLGNGDGTFAALPAVPAGAGTYLPSLAIGDFNGDGNADIATANVDNLADNVAIFLGNGDGTFQAYKNTQVNASSSFPIADVKVGDLNRDGKLDVAALIAPMGAIPGTLYVLLGTGNGDFGSPISVTTKQPAGQFALGDINGDGITDVVTNGGGIEYLRGRGDGTFESQAQIETFSGTFGIALGDLNADNRLDVLTSTFYDGSTIVMNEKGGFGEPVTLPTGSAVVSYQTAIADFNNDGQPDFVASYTGVYLSVSSYLSPLSLVFPYGTGVPDAPQTITLTNSGPRGIDITGFTFSGLQPMAFSQTNDCNGAVRAQSSCTLTVTFLPIADGSNTAWLNVATSSGTQTASLIGSANGEAPVVRLSGDQLNWGSVPVGMPGLAAQVKLTNIGGENLTSLNIAMTGADTSDFAITGDTCRAMVKPSASCIVTIVFTPIATGARSALLTFTDNAYTSPQTVALSGTGK